MGVWLKWFPWRFLVRHLARAQGFLDPFLIFAQIQRFAQPSKLAAPVELLRLAAVLHARGLMNSQAIQHNLDWIWPYWVECQFNPHDQAFVPRAFLFTHINLTHRNWTAVGIPDSEEYVLIDPRGLVTPFYDGWSVDVWVVSKYGDSLIPSRLSSVSQDMLKAGNLAVATHSENAKFDLTLKTEVIEKQKKPICRIELNASAFEPARMVVSLRPYNPEGVSFIDEISLLHDRPGWKVNRKNCVYLSERPDRFIFSEYGTGDVYNKLNEENSKQERVSCKVGMATSAAIYEIKQGDRKSCAIEIPLASHAEEDPHWVSTAATSAAVKWNENLNGTCKLQVPDARFQRLYEAAVRTLILHAPKEIFPGPYTYKHFWFRDAAFIIHALLCLGLRERAEKTLDQFPHRQTPFGYFHSQEGEWDSNGEALWIMNQYCRMTHAKPKAAWKGSIKRAAHWIQRKRLKDKRSSPHDGLFPPGFSAEHLGPIDYYYWDDFWGVSGLRSAASLMDSYGDHDIAAEFRLESDYFMNSITRSLDLVSQRTKNFAMPASPYRRMDTGAIGSITVSYPLQLWEENDKRVIETINYLVNECFIAGGFFHNMSHSGINPYLTLQIAQVLLRAGDPRYWPILESVAHLATSTGQWPEAIHPKTRGGCMGDGQHVWASAEWVLMIRNCFVREEGTNKLVLCSGLPEIWLEESTPVSLGPTLTLFGAVSVFVQKTGEETTVSWKGDWFHKAPEIEIRLAGRKPVSADSAKNQFTFQTRKLSL